MCKSSTFITVFIILGEVAGAKETSQYHVGDKMMEGENMGTFHNILWH